VIVAALPPVPKDKPLEIINHLRGQWRTLIDVGWG
jgi:hypothetical protein